MTEIGTPIDLTPFEAEHYVQCLEEIDLEEVGSKDFLTQHSKTEKLSVMAHYQAEDHTDEFIVDYVVTHDKLPTLIHNLIVIETWKQNVFPHLREEVSKMSSLRSYIPLYYEAVTVGLVEMCMFNATACEAAGDALVDLIDYVYRKLTYLVMTPNKELWTMPVQTAKEAMDKSDLQLLKEQYIMDYVRTNS